jgi:nitrite reductase/ring-hydroxylating ferredoxin subunit
MNTDMNRRTALFGAATVAGVAALAACSNGGVTTASDTKTAAAGTGEGTAIGSVAPPKVAATTNATNAAAAENSLAKTSDIAVGGGVIFTADKVVVTQPTAGTYKAFTAVCTHQGCTVGSIASGHIVCPCHGSAFSITDGSVVNGPATTPLAPAKITVTGGDIKLG